MKARIIGTLLVRDEEDIIQQCIDHHVAQGIYEFIVTDNGSTDHTREILNAHPNVLCVTSQPDYTYRQPAWVTEDARFAHTMGADWVVNIDADEFWYNLHVLHDLPKTVGQVLVKDIRNYVATENLSNYFDQSEYRYYTIPHNTRGKTIHRASPDVQISLGNHRVKNVPGKRLQNTSIHVKHYPNRTLDHFTKKCRHAGSLAERKDVNQKNHWIDLWNLHKNGMIAPYYRNHIVHTDEWIMRGLSEGSLFDEKERGATTGCAATGTSEAST